MGAWGHGSFENDSALDWLADLEEGEASMVADALATVADAESDEYIDADDACAALAAAELVAAALGNGDDRLNPGAAEWLQSNRSAVAQVGATHALAGIERVFNSSELRELWDENGEDTEWHADVRELLRRLQS